MAAGLITAAALCVAPLHVSLADTITIPADTRVFVTTLEEIIGKKGQVREGQRVRANVWKDVVVGKRTVISKGTPVLVKVDFFKKAKIAGRKGKISLGAYEVEAVDGSAIQLNGGYFKQGKGRIALVATLAGVVFVPLIFIKGKKAKLPEGTVFDAYTTNAIEVDFQSALPPRSFSFGPAKAAAPVFEAVILYEELEGVDAPRYFPVSITAADLGDPKFVVDRINGEKSRKLKVEDVELVSCEAQCTYRGNIPIKKLVKKFKKGLNTIEVSTDASGERLSSEILVEVEI